MKRFQLFRFTTLTSILCLAVMVGCDTGTTDPDTDPDCVTEVNADIESATTWGGECRTIEVLSSIFVDAPLTVLPGTTVLADQGVHIGVRADGSLNAIGTEADPIVFDGMVADPGFWSGISIASVDAANQLEWVEILHTGAAGGRLFHGNVDAALVVMGQAHQSRGKVLLTDVLLADGSGIGLSLAEGGDISGSTNLNIEDDSGATPGMSYPIQIAFPEVGQLDSSFRTRTGHPTIVTRGHLKREATIPSDMSGVLQFQQGVEIRDGGFLIVEHGNYLGFEQDVMLATSPNGRLALRGEEDSPIVVSGAEAGAGYWGGFVFQSLSMDNEVRHAAIVGAGAKGWQGRKAGILVTGQSTSRGMVRVENTQFREIDGHGIEILEGGELTESGNTFEELTGNPIEDHNP